MADTLSQEYWPELGVVGPLGEHLLYTKQYAVGWNYTEDNKVGSLPKRACSEGDRHLKKQSCPHRESRGPQFCGEDQGIFLGEVMVKQSWNIGGD